MGTSSPHRPQQEERVAIHTRKLSTLNGMRNYHTLVNELIERQLLNWDTARSNYKALTRAKTRRLVMGQAAIVLQFNPERIRSSAARVDAESLRARDCFLCQAHQPAEQEAVEWRGKYKIQVNPYPIFPRHLTIASLAHTPQSIEGRVGDLLALADDLQDYVIFYNGPRCGASAPDHQHFQAGNRDFLPFCNELWPFDEIDKRDDFVLELCTNKGCNVFLLSATNVASAERVFATLQEARPVRAGEREPMQNVLCWKDGEWWRVALFPRMRHRPSNYGEGEGHFLLSPASVDLGGLWAVPVEKDFNTLTTADLEKIIAELCMNRDEINQVINIYNQKSNEI